MGFLDRIFRKADAGQPGDVEHDEILWHPGQYRGQAVVSVTATQLDHIESAAERRRIYRSWIDFFSSPTDITDLDLRSRVPQDLLDSLAGQPQLRSLNLKWGPYRDIGVVDRLPELEILALGGATALESFEPLRGRHGLATLSIQQPYRATDLSPLSTLRSLNALTFGGFIGSDKSVVLPGLLWLEPLKSLRSLALPGTRLIDPDLSPLLSLPELEELHIPLRRKYRAQVFAFAESSPVFAGVAADYTAYEEWSADLRRRSAAP